ncbi:MAG TPA: hypothetical protein PLL06_19475 [Acidobacteriota bacterium]|nr:hypothetical protein [Acidobacteriota bacterium]HNG92075.1 hypothetical protein [Acidobacteriota bacterium]HNJ43364.1 hypothetical protein [Acidobacteriota bacterium]
MERGLDVMVSDQYGASRIGVAAMVLDQTGRGPHRSFANVVCGVESLVVRSCSLRLGLFSET